MIPKNIDDVAELYARACADWKRAAAHLERVRAELEVSQDEAQIAGYKLESARRDLIQVAAGLASADSDARGASAPPPPTRGASGHSTGAPPAGGNTGGTVTVVYDGEAAPEDF